MPYVWPYGDIPLTYILGGGSSRGSRARGLELTPVFLIGAFYVANGWVVGVAGMIITSDEMDHSRKFPAFSTSKFLSGPTLLPFPTRVISPTSRDEPCVRSAPNTTLGQFKTWALRQAPRKETELVGFLGIPNGHFSKLKNGEFKFNKTNVLCLLELFGDSLWIQI